jgi:hypothetical protein
LYDDHANCEFELDGVWRVFPGYYVQIEDGQETMFNF